MFIKHMKLFILTLLIFVFLFGIVSFAEQRTESITAPTPLPVPRVVKDRQLVVGFILNGLTAESYQRWNVQVNNEANARGWKLISAIDSTTAELTRLSFENFINQDVDAIIFRGVSIEGTTDLILKAREKGIGVYNLDMDLKDGVIVDTTMPGGIAGAYMAYYGINRLNKTGNVIIYTMTSELVRQRSCVAKALVEDIWPTLNLLHLDTLRKPGWEKEAFDYTQNYLTKYDNDIQWIFSSWDMGGIIAAKAVEEAGLTRDDCFITGIDGGTQAYSEIRKGTPFVATMSQSFEVFVHDLFEVINQVQIEGIAPGDPGSIVPNTRTIYSYPVLTTPENCPEPGTKIHEIFDYYDPDDKDAWYNWGEPYMIK